MICPALYAVDPAAIRELADALGFPKDYVNNARVFLAPDPIERDPSCLPKDVIAIVNQVELIVGRSCTDIDSEEKILANALRVLGITFSNRGVHFRGETFKSADHFLRELIATTKLYSFGQGMPLGLRYETDERGLGPRGREINDDDDDMENVYPSVYGAQVGCDTLRQLKEILESSLFCTRDGSWYFVPPGSVMGVLLLSGPVDVRARSECTVLKILISNKEKCIAFPPNEQGQALEAAKGFFAFGSGQVSVTSIVGPPISLFEGCVKSDHRIIHIRYNDVQHLMQRFHAEVDKDDSAGSVDSIQMSMNAVQPFSGATVMDVTSNGFTLFNTTLSRGESMPVAVMNANTAAAEMDGSGSLDFPFLTDGEISQIPPVPELAVQVNGSLTDSTSSCIPPPPTMGLEALGAADRAKGMIDPDDQFYARAKAVCENTMNAPGGKRLKYE